jgi:Lon protease-like protein
MRSTTASLTLWNCDRGRYQALQAQFIAEQDEARRDLIEEAMTQLLSNIERNRDTMSQLARDINKIKVSKGTKSSSQPYRFV